MSEYIVEVTGQMPDAIYERELTEIVRCRDCESYEPDMYEHFTCEYLHRWTKPDDFCAWGERKQ